MAPRDEMDDAPQHEPATEASPIRRGHAAMAFFLPVLLLAPFANKAYNFDDPAFLWVAEQIRQEPLDFFGSVVDQGYKQTPMYAFNHNPPGVSYYLAFLSLFFGWEEIPLHLGMNLITGLGGLGIYFLAARLCRRPLLGTLLAVATPAFLVSASNLMTDIAMLTFYVWALYFWMVGLDQDRTGMLALSGVSIALSSISKYFGITAVPLFIAYGLIKRRRLGAWALWLLIPLVFMAAFQLYTRSLYGSANLSDAVDIALSDRFRLSEGALFRPIAILIFLGGTFLPLAFYAPWIYRLRTLAIGSGVVALSLVPLIEGYSPLQLVMGIPEPFDLIMTLHVGIMFAAGIFVVSLIVPELIRMHSAESALLFFLIAGTLAFAVFINHFVNTRVLLPILPAVVVLIGRHAKFPESDSSAAPWYRQGIWWPLAPALVLSLWVLGGDYLAGSNSRNAVQRAVEIAEAEGVPFYFSGFGAFHYYAEKAGGRPFDAEFGDLGTTPKPKMQRGELLAADSEGTINWIIPPEGFVAVEVHHYRNPFGVTTYHPELETGFYNHMGGFLPYVAGRIPPEPFGVYRWVGESYAPPEEPEP